jgi:hypothetical protein
MAGLVDVKSLDAFLGGEQSAKNDTSSDHWAAIARTDPPNNPDEFIKPKKNHGTNQLPSEGGNRNVETGHTNSTHVVETDYESNLASKAKVSGADTKSAAISGPESTTGLMHGATMNKEQETIGASTCLPCCFGAKPQPKPSYTPAEEAGETQEIQRDAPRAALVCGYLDPAASQRTADAVSAAAAASEHLCSGWMATFTAHNRRGPSRTPEPPKQHVAHAVLAWLDSAFSAEPASLQPPPPPPPPAAAATARGGCFGWWRRGSGGAAEARGTARGYAPGPAVLGFERDVAVVRDKDGQVDHRPGQVDHRP